MRELFLRRLTLEDDAGAAHCYEYYLVIDEMDVGRFACESYGLRIVEQDTGRGAIVPHITCSVARIDELCELMLQGCVTPESLKDVVCDWL